MIEQLLDWLVGLTGSFVAVGLFVVAGVVLLKQGADGLVNGSSNIGLRLGISKLMTGLTIVAFGTSAPELVVSTLTALGGQPEICLGNVIGSNLANTALILGVSALITPIAIQKSSVLSEGLHSMLSIALVMVLAWIGSRLGRFDGVILLTVFGFWMFWLIRDSRKPGKYEHMPHGSEDDISFHERPWGMDVLFSILGLLALVIGANLLVEGAVYVGKLLGVPVAFIGITIVAVGTSLPELAVSIVAAMKGHPELTVGNVFGSNIFNALLILGVACVIHPISFAAVPGDGQASLNNLFIDLPFTTLICGAVLPLMIYKSRLGRGRGVLLLLMYFGFLGFLIMRLP